MAIRTLYNSLIPSEWRYQLYKFRNPGHFKKLRNAVYPSEKGDFSLTPFDRHECIFVHITKSAGTSVAKGLFSKLPYHYTASQYRVIFGRKDFNRYFKFAFVRNPWDRLYSSFCYLKGGGWNDSDRQWAGTHLDEIDDFNQFVVDWMTPERLHAHIHFWPQYEFICDWRGNLLIDHLAYFETIQSDFHYLANRIGVDGQLKHVNASKRASYRDIYSDEAIDKVRQLYSEDIERFGYTFDAFEKININD